MLLPKRRRPNKFDLSALTNLVQAKKQNECDVDKFGIFIDEDID
jgi:hypothetical protein